MQFKTQENRLLKLRVQEQDSQGHRQQRLLREIIAKFKNEKSKELVVHDKKVAALRARIIRLET